MNIDINFNEDVNPIFNEIFKKIDELPPEKLVVLCKIYVAMVYSMNRITNSHNEVNINSLANKPNKK